MGKDSTWGMTGHLDDSQVKTLAELRRRVTAELKKKPYLESDETLLRFLRARGFNLHKSFTMIKEDVEWREQFEGYDFIVSRDFRGAYVMHEERCIYLTGKSRDGRPILTIRARHFWPKLVDDPLQVVYFFRFYIDGVCKMAEDAGHLTFFGILDLEGFGYANFSFQLVKIAISILQDHYPERLGSIMVVNAPFIFSAVWKMIQPLLDERTRSKIDILGSNLEKLQEHIEPTVLEPKYGGTHEQYPVPDVIAQIALDNEKLLLIKPTERASGAATPPEPSTPTGTTSGSVPGVSSSSRNGKPLVDAEQVASKKKKSLRRMLKQMLFNTDRRATAASLGRDPNTVDDSPTRLVSKDSETLGNGKKPGGVSRLLSTASGVRVPGMDGEDDLGAVDVDDDDKFVELKVAHDKLLGKIMDLNRHVDELSARFTTQFHALVAILIGVVAFQVMMLYNQEGQQQQQQQ